MHGQEFWKYVYEEILAETRERIPLIKGQTRIWCATRTNNSLSSIFTIPASPTTSEKKTKVPKRKTPK
ncbi:hypothetical protein CRE_09337 [Caenorhabditis remanei]|uniref:Uncharacterized protein n=1 Tax=Caenorhabditis remanei TaxID=31234 RepID=E3LI75_CAERE|nr:hypothetical protein CRE_09337 [Caenorhabditis remanei]